jgi:hypothetical protein
MQATPAEQWTIFAFITRSDSDIIQDQLLEYTTAAQSSKAHQYLRDSGKCLHCMYVQHRTYAQLRITLLFAASCGGNC